MDSDGLYIHIPFCHGKCIYCDFYSQPRRTGMDDVVVGIISELHTRRAEADYRFGTIYIGGGTPSFLPDTLLQQLIEALPVSGISEFTIEVNPEDVTADRARLWRSLGVNRVSMGVQTFDAGILRRIGRRHTPERALQAVLELRSAGFDNISCDLIYGLPGQTQDIWCHDLETLLATGIEHLSAYCLTYYEGTMLHRMAAAGRIAPQTDDEIADKYDLLLDLTARAGMEHYEISNFSRPGRRSVHNSNYWSPDGRWLGLGPAAYSFDGRVRRYNPADTDTWLKGLPDASVAEDETPLDLVNDHIVTALRTACGLDLSALPPDMIPGLLADAAPALASGLLVHTGSHIAIPHRHWLIADAIIRPLIRI